jgi:16S rRNA (adenine1518-N6/adenine1519-N6)-dimethyltransferase
MVNQSTVASSFIPLSTRGVAMTPPSTKRNAAQRSSHPYTSGRPGQRRSPQPDMAFRQNNPLLAQARKVLAHKRFGQNFLIHPAVHEGIVRCLNLQPTDHVVEIGPGLGFLTQHLLDGAAHVTAIELERGMVAHLTQHFAQHPKFTLVEGDFLAYPLADLTTPTFKVVGNIPYNLTSAIVFKLVGELTDVNHPLRQRLEQVTLMVQKEVAERLCAQPGCKAYGPLSIATQFWFDPWIVFNVPAEAFEPIPRVESAVISLTPRTQPSANVTDLASFHRLVRGVFTQRRKALRNTLPNVMGISQPLALEALALAQLDPMLRPEMLTVADFGRLADVLTQLPR